MIRVVSALMISAAALVLHAEVYEPGNMQRMASAAVAMSKGKANGIKEVTAAFEFRGYVAAILDNDKQFLECRKHDLDTITNRSASLTLIAMDDVAEERSASVSAVLAVMYACDSLEDSRK